MGINHFPQATQSKRNNVSFTPPPPPLPSPHARLDPSPVPPLTRCQQVVVAKAALQSIRLGDAVGANNVWARHESAGQTPPRSGWRVPWDSTKQQELLVSAVAEVTY